MGHVICEATIWPGSHDSCGFDSHYAFDLFGEIVCNACCSCAMESPRLFLTFVERLCGLLSASWQPCSAHDCSIIDSHWQS